MKESFHKIATKISLISGTPVAFIAALTLVLLWAITGPFFEYSNTWQLVINTTTTIVTFLMVFLIQNTQNRDAKAMQLKLDELIRSSTAANDNFIDLEDMSDDALEHLDKYFKDLKPTHPDAVVAQSLNSRLKVVLQKRKK